jgi:hypothetical protein
MADRAQTLSLILLENKRTDIDVRPLQRRVKDQSLDKEPRETIATIANYELTLLKYSKRLAIHARIHSAIQAKIAASPLLRASLARVRSAWTIATNKDPKQIDPKDVVTVRIKELHTPLEQHPDSSGATHYMMKTKCR